MKTLAFSSTFFAPKNMSLVHAGWKAQNYHTGAERKIRRSKLAAQLEAFIEGPDWNVVAVKEPSALST